MRKGQLQKSEVTRARILEVALQLFAEKGFGGSTMREIADRAGCSTGLTYRYFRSKDALALELYLQLVEGFEAEAHQIAPGPLGKRWGAIMRRGVARLEPYRATLTGMTAAGLAPGSATQVLGPESAAIRRRMLVIFERIVSGSNDLPRAADTAALATLLYGVHLLLVFFWLQDPTPGQRATSELLAFSEEHLGWLKLVLRIPGGPGSVRRLSGILRPILEGEPTAGHLIAQPS